MDNNVQGNYSADTGVGLFNAAIEHVSLLKHRFMAKNGLINNAKPILQNGMVADI